MVPTERAQRQQVLLDALWSPPERKAPTEGTFAACKVIKYSEGFLLKSFPVEGAGELQLPLSAEGTPKLQSVCEQAPFGKGLATVMDTSVRRCWQVDSSKVTFPGTPTFLSDTFQPLAEKMSHAFSLHGPGLKLEAHLYQLLFYVAGYHFTRCTRTRRREGVFPTLILQLPTEEGYTGGKLLLRHHKEVKQFDCHMVSPLGFCYTTFLPIPFTSCSR